MTGASHNGRGADLGGSTSHTTALQRRMKTSSKSRPLLRRLGWSSVAALTCSVVVTLVTGGCSVVGIRGEEIPNYEVVQADEETSVELRSYEPMIVAATRVDSAEMNEGGNQAFRRLAGYIFGDNRDERSMAMTAPVTQSPAEVESRSLPMTAPVTHVQDDDGGAVWTFYMPSNETMDTLPQPNDSRVELREMPGRLVAAIRFTGFFTDANFREEEARLREWLDANGLRATSSARSAAYDPPWTIPFLRRNEVLIDVERVE